MDPVILKQHLETYREHIARNPGQYQLESAERGRRCDYYQGWTRDRLLAMEAGDLFQYVSGLSALVGWRNQHYLVDKMIQDNGLEPLRRALAELQWGAGPLERRWDLFRAGVKGFGPAITSEMLCYAHPSDCMVWNRRSYAGFTHLGIRALPLHGYQLTGSKYRELTLKAQLIADEMKDFGLEDASLPAVDTLLCFQPRIPWVKRWGGSWFKDI